VQVTGKSGVCVASNAYGRGRIMCTLAGEIGESISRQCILPPSKEKILAFIAKARCGEEGLGL
jgi:hypothetical protein